MRTGRVVCALAMLELMLGLVAAGARADCPTAQAACLLHEEGVALLAARQFDAAAAKFAASVTAGVSARAELGLALAQEGAGRLGLAYDAIAEADRLMMAEQRDASSDDDARAREERIKYVLGDLRSRVILIHVQVPVTGEPGDSLAAVQREGRDVGDPGAAIAAAPGEPLIALLRSGARRELVVEGAPGGEQVWIVPVPERTRWYRELHPAIGLEAVMLPGAGVATGGGLDTGLGAGGLVHGTLGFGGLGGFAGGRLAITARGGYVAHGSSAVASSASPSLHETQVSHEIVGLAGVRVALWGPLYAVAELGVVATSGTDQLVNTSGAVVASSPVFDETALVYGLGLEARWRRFDARAGILGAASTLSQQASAMPPNGQDVPVRAMLSIGMDVYPW